MFFFVLVSLAAFAADTPARAYWEISYSGFTYSHTYNGANAGSTSYNPGTPVSAGGGWPGGASSAETSESFTIQGTWLSPPGAPAPAPPNAVIQVSSTAQASVTYNGTTTGAEVSSEALGMEVEGWADDGFGDGPNAQGVSAGTHYVVVTVTSGSFSLPLSLSSGMPSSNGYVSASVGPVTVSAVTGYWDGPYYMHYGNYSSDSQTPTPWPNNTPTLTPEPNDVADSKNFFSFESTADSLYDYGSITPVWYWNGPSLGIAPPGFEAIETSFASMNDPSTEDYPAGNISDGQGSTQVSPAQDNGFVAYQDYDFYNVIVETDQEAPSEGVGYIAMGQTINLSADPRASGLSATDMMGDVSLTASIYSGLGD